MKVGDELPTEKVELTPTFVIKTAMASRDFEEVHHDPEIARSNGLDHIFLNILTTNGLCQRLVVDWAGPGTVVKRASVRLGVPALAGTTLELSGSVIERRQSRDGGDEIDVQVVGMVPGGRHCKALVTIDGSTASTLGGAA